VVGDHDRVMKVLHVLETSVPELIGYTIRGQYIIQHQRQQGIEPIVVTSPFFRGANDRRVDEIGGVRYFRSNHIPAPDRKRGRLQSYWTRLNMVRRYRSFVAEVARAEKPDVIHAHSSYMNGLAGGYASKKVGLPFVYEMRGLWHDTAVVEDGLVKDSFAYRTVWRLELGVMRQAGVVVVISRGLRDLLVERGIDPAKIAVVPNGVDTSVFTPRPPDTALRTALGLDGCFVVGFIGSLRRLEGIALLVEAFKDVVRREPRARLLIVGEGPERSRMAAAAAEAGLSDVVRLTGLVPHDEILRYYSVMDLLAYPRIDVRTTQTVTPLKPLEAMAMGKVCLASDVGGLKELVDHGQTGLLFASGDARDLTEKILMLASDPTLLSRLSGQAQVTVGRDREWSTIVSSYSAVYHRAGVPS
jgi:glycogen synthase